MKVVMVRVRKLIGVFAIGVVALGLFCGILILPQAAQAKGPKLPAQYDKWLNEEVVYIISKDERDAFLQLPSDADRDVFIQRFWDLRNPTPGAPTNPYKDEIYRRISYVNQFFREPTKNGWQTARGRIYIQLGPPQQRAPYNGAGIIRPTEVWFYQNANGALPPFFSIVFYVRDNDGEYRLYSPYFDGPQALTTSLNSQNTREGAFVLIERDLGREFARTLLTLLPDEPVDLSTYTSSLESDVMLSTIKNLPNHPLTKEAIKRNAQLLENVSHRMILGSDFLDVFTVPLRNSDGNMSLHYLLRLQKPEEFGVGQAKDRFYYSVEAEAHVSGPDGKRIFSQKKSISDFLTEAQLNSLKGKLFGYEGVLPLAPGKYKIEFVLTNTLKNTSYKAEREIVVPNPEGVDLRLSDPVPFSSAEPLGPAADILPFSAAGVKFTPQVNQELDLPSSQELKIFYQIWRDSKTGGTVGNPLQVDYVYGRLGRSGEANKLHEEVAATQFDTFGSMVNGKKIPLTGLEGGNYRMLVTVADPVTNKKAFGSVNFRVVSEQTPARAWDTYAKDLAQDVAKGVNDFNRGLTYLAQGDAVHAAEWLNRAVQKDPANEQARTRLADYYFSKQDFAKVTQLYARVPVTKEIDEQTILRVADSMAKGGDTTRAIEWMESALNVKGTSQAIYLTLASLYEKSGNATKAAEMERKGKNLEHPN